MGLLKECAGWFIHVLTSRFHSVVPASYSLWLGKRGLVVQALARWLPGTRQAATSPLQGEGFSPGVVSHCLHMGGTEHVWASSGSFSAQTSPCHYCILMAFVLLCQVLKVEIASAPFFGSAQAGHMLWLAVSLVLASTHIHKDFVYTFGMFVTASLIRV